MALVAVKAVGCDTEFADFLRDLAIVIEPRLANPPTKRRRRRIVASVMLPAPDQPTRDDTSAK